MFTLARKERASGRLIKHAGAPFRRPVEVNSTYGVDKTLMSFFTSLLAEKQALH
jgi:hypothetical protein